MVEQHPPAITLPLLSAEDRLHHAIFTRHGGASMAPFESLNLSHSVSDRAETVDANRTRAYALLGRTGQELVHAHLAHGNHVAVASPTDHGQVVGPADGLIALVPGTGLTMNFADCSPIMIYDPRLHAMGLGHAGWKGAVADLPGALVRAMQAEFGTIPADLVAAIGPSIGECCYEVGEELQRSVEHTFDRADDLFSTRNDRLFFDLVGANLRRLKESGVVQLASSGYCTASRTDLFFSHRAERGQTGRFGVVMELL